MSKIIKSLNLEKSECTKVLLVVLLKHLRPLTLGQNENVHLYVIKNTID